MKGLKLLLILVAFLQNVATAQANTGIYKMVKQDDIITLYERWINNDKGETVRELKAVLLVKSDMNEVTALLTNNAKGKKWNTSASEYKVIGHATDGYWITYTRYDIPWPFEDQDCSLRYTVVNKTSSNVEIMFDEYTDPQFPLHEGVTRIAGTHGKWILEDQRNGYVKLTYFISTDRSKKVPKWCSDMVVHSNMFKTLTAFKNTLEKE
ncbi:MAG: hypothetical protein EOP51_08935 [Sphingobacteriales bacterium]|nr:MAG: hypothetical protein EOP51_08935 [Sphingobacteriales bacterium]